MRNTNTLYLVSLREHSNDDWEPKMLFETYHEALRYVENILGDDAFLGDNFDIVDVEMG